jgi:type VI secretion system secreted protein Hcp
MANFVVRSESSGVEVLRIQLEDTLVTSYQIGGSGGDIVPTDSFSLNFSKIEFEYTPHKDGKAGSPIKTGYDLTTSTKT